MTTGSQLESVYDPRSVEAEVHAAWERSGAFRSHPQDPPAPHERTFTIVMPPPNVTGALHLGHALNNTLQDILVRYHRMRGFVTLWQPGTDHAGIATQAVVERRIREQEGKSRHDLGREELVRRIWQWKDEYERRIIGQLKMLGCSADWERNRFTLDEGLARAVRQMFFNLFKDGLIFRGKRLVNWDTELQTAVADDEIYYETIKGQFWHFKYPVIEPKPGEPEYVVIATTRPETMLGDTAVAVNPDPAGALDRLEKKLADSLATAAAKDRPEIEKRLEALCERRRTHLPQLIRLAEMAKAGRKIKLPLVCREIPLIADEWADPSLGSGCVKITPAHDPNDYEVGLRHKLPMINVLSPDGKVARIVEPDGSVNKNNSRYEGLAFTIEARQRVVADLEERGLLDHVEDRDREVGHSDRSKTAIEPFLSDQWFVRTSEPRASACADARESTASDLNADGDTPDYSASAVLLTWTTYGTWLPGSEKGVMSRVPADDGRHEIHNIPGEPYDANEPPLRDSAEQRMTGTPVQLTDDQAKTVFETVADVCERHAIVPLAVAVMRTHVHVLCQSERSGSELLQLFKGNASKNLNERFSLRDAPRWWTKSGSARWSKSDDLTEVIEYVKAQQGCLLLWSFDRAHGPAAKLFAAARARARHAQAEVSRTSAQAKASGSLGLAQRAMDAARDERVQIFPERYTKSYLDWLGEKRDWCISRQLWWGHRIPVWSQEIAFGLVSDPDMKLGRLFSFARNSAVIRIETNDRLATWDFDPSGRWPDWLEDLGDSDLLRVLMCPQAEVRLSMSERQRLADDANTFGITEIYVNERDPETGRSTNKLKEKIDETPGWRRDFSVEDFQCQADFVIACAEHAGFGQDPDVLDTWFSSALWPFSTLGWPEDTPHLKQFYPGRVLVTSRDIITNWVARMVMFGLYAMGDVPFDHVYIHPKILDGRGETMSKSKGNGVDPVDIIHTHGADALRYTMADMCTETQDIRMPVDYVCPHCGALTEQSLAIKAEEQFRKSRGQKLERKLQPSDCKRVKCASKECGKEFATQWAEAALKEELGVARETSEKFEIGRNFCTKLWNAARYAFMNLGEAPTSAVEPAFQPVHLMPEDRWILAKLSQTIREYHQAIGAYQFSASIKVLRDFFWDSLCDWYLELTKPRLTEGATPGISGATARRVLAFCLDQSLRLLHPTIPFITERLWAQLSAAWPHRGLPGLADAPPSAQLVLAEFPPEHGYPFLDDAGILSTFEQLQDATRGIRDLRMRCNVPPRQKVHVTVVVPADHVASFRAQAHIVKHLASVDALTVAADAQRPPNAGSIAVHGLRIYVHDISNDTAERDRATKALAAVEKQIAVRESKLNNPGFVAKADPQLIAAERQRLAEQVAERDNLRLQLAELS